MWVPPPRPSRILGGCLAACIAIFAADAALTPVFAQQTTTTPQPSPLQTPTTTTTPQGTTTPLAQQPRRKAPLGAPQEATTARSESVLRRQIMDRPPGYDVGSFIAHGEVQAGVEYDDNIFRSNNAAGNPPPVSDFIGRIAPKVTLQSDWSEHALDFFIGSEFGFYLNNPSQNYINYAVGTHGRYDIDENQSVDGTLEYYRNVLPRGTPGIGVFGNQSFVNVLNADVKYLYTGEPFYLRIGPRFQNNVFEGTAPSSNYNYFDVSARVGYRLTEEFSVFIDPSVQVVRYPGGIDFTGFDANSQGYDVRVGVTYDLSTEIGLEAAVGYYQRWYQAGAIAPDSGLSAKLALYWNPSENWSFEVTGMRGLSQYRVITGTTPNGNAVATEVQARAGWLAKDNLLIDVGVGYAIYEFQDISLNQNYLGADVGARYYFNENYWIGPRYFYSSATSSNPTVPYTDNRIMLTVGARL